MASTPREGLKQSLLLAFLALSVVLVALVWADNLSDRPTGGTGFVRSTPTAPLTHVALSATPTATLTPTPLSVLATLTLTAEADD
ncbi:MAG: hypothetical protein ABI847_00085 [Anaerolineales bacterium]